MKFESAEYDVYRYFAELITAEYAVFRARRGSHWQNMMLVKTVVV